MLILRTQELTGSYAAGGLVAGAFALALGVAAPILGRAIDRRGQTGVLIWSALASTVRSASSPSPRTATPPRSPWPPSPRGGRPAPVNSCLRALWSQVLAPERRHRAFNIDSVVFEIVYISGPLLIVGAIGAWSMQAAVVACALPRRRRHRIRRHAALARVAARQHRHNRPARRRCGVTASAS